MGSDLDNILPQIFASVPLKEVSDRIHISNFKCCFAGGTGDLQCLSRFNRDPHFLGTAGAIDYFFG